MRHADSVASDGVIPELVARDAAGLWVGHALAAVDDA
jgi:hypothetical protein